MENEAKCLQGFVTLALNTYYIAFIQNMTVQSYQIQLHALFVQQIRLELEHTAKI